MGSCGPESLEQNPGVVECLLMPTNQYDLKNCPEGSSSQAIQASFLRFVWSKQVPIVEVLEGCQEGPAMGELYLG